MKIAGVSATRSGFISTGLQPGDQKPSIEIKTVSTVSPTFIGKPLETVTGIAVDR
jgi:hypothetical protein